MNRDFFFWVKLESALDCTPFAGPVGGLSRSYRLGYAVVRPGFGFAAMNVDNMFTYHTPTPAQQLRINSLRKCARMLAREI
jgi:hypothetical protein